MIVKTNALSEEQIGQVRHAEAQVKEKDRSFGRMWLSNSLNYDKTLPCFFMYYEGGSLVAFLTLFMPDCDVAEVSAFTLPECRRKGYFGALLDSAKRSLPESVEVIFAAEGNSVGEAIAKKSKRFVHLRTENRMKLCGENTLKNDANLKMLKTVSDEQINVQISYVAFCGSQKVGEFFLNVESFYTFIYGVEVPEVFRGKGYGKSMMSIAVNEALLTERDVILDVDATNVVAINIYERCGFAQIGYTKYYRAL